MLAESRNWLFAVAAAGMAFAVASPAFAQWTGKGEAGVAMASGNTDSTSANARVAIARKVENWEHSASLAGVYLRNDGDTTAKRLELGLQTRYSFSGATYWYGGLRYEQDKFSGFDHPGVISTGVGRKFQVPSVFRELTVCENLEVARAPHLALIRTSDQRVSNPLSADPQRYYGSEKYRRNARGEHSDRQ